MRKKRKRIEIPDESCAVHILTNGWFDLNGDSESSKKSTNRKPERMLLEGFDTGYGDSHFLIDLKDYMRAMQFPNPETLVIQKNLLENLSKEASELLFLILNTPLELVDQIRQKKKQQKMTMSDLRKYTYNKLNWKRKQWVKAKLELKAITKKL